MAARAGEWTKVYHCICKVREERCGVGAIIIDLSVGGSSVEEFLIRVEKTLLTLQILDVRNIERGWTGNVGRGEVVVAASARTFRLNGSRELRIYVGFVQLAVKPLFEKAVIRALRLESGPGRLPELAALKLAIVESLLPNGTDQLGPPNCKIFHM
ncbi:hypothetical protein RHMOL_Rhmol05G0317800 [Rhododendron molle]|uniref:Uncharacterized protein n=1 Tax=Rhododendron molle TaxID=49168 RepID=A0ACC0NVF6_RHOML|nr:hypothetical protein RHMOL_Rhmol05G0317800 [Rhododendron molle]